VIHPGGRQLKRVVGDLLRQPDLNGSIEVLLRYPARQVVNPLISFFYSGDETVKWRAVSAVGAVTAALADREMESARVVMRRLMWSLNDESGGIGWGSPEAMGDIMARHERLAAEFCAILVSYADEGGNYLEHPLLQRGVLWGLGRLAHANASRVMRAAQLLPPYLRSSDALKRGLALWAAGALPCPAGESLIRRLAADTATVPIWIGDRLVDCRLQRLAESALKRLRGPI